MQDARLVDVVATPESNGMYAAGCDAARCAYRSVIFTDERPSNPRIKNSGIPPDASIDA